MKANYMDFPKVQSALKTELTSLLERNPCGKEQLSTWIDQVVISVSNLCDKQQGEASDVRASEFDSLTKLVLESAEKSPWLERTGNEEKQKEEKGEWEEEKREIHLQIGIKKKEVKTKKEDVEGGPLSDVPLEEKGEEN